jgi:hypothetical protein
MNAEGQFEDAGEEVLAEKILDVLLETGTDKGIQNAYEALGTFRKKFKRNYNDLLEIPFCRKLFELLTEEVEYRREVINN